MTTRMTQREAKELHKKVKSALQGYHQAKELQDALVMSLVTSSNLILYGPGGYGKSDATFKAASAVYGMERVLVIPMSSATTEAQILGGIDFAAMRGEATDSKGNPVKPHVRYQFDRGIFGDWDVIVLEEMLSAPDKVVAALRSHLTLGFYPDPMGEEIQTQYGVARGIPMRAKVVIGTTNIDPEKWALKGDEYDALIQRFPMRQRVAWEKHTRNDYIAVAEANGIPVNDMTKKVARFAETAPRPISPRTFVKAALAVHRAQHLNGKRRILALSPIPGFNVDEIAQMIKREEIIDIVSAKLNRLSDTINEAFSKMDIDKPETIVGARRVAKEAEEDLSDLSTPEELWDRRREVENSISELVMMANEMSIQLVEKLAGESV